MSKSATDITMKSKSKKPQDMLDVKHIIVKLDAELQENTDYDKWDLSYFNQNTGRVTLTYSGKTLDDFALKTLESIAKKLFADPELFLLRKWKGMYEFSYVFDF